MRTCRRRAGGSGGDAWDRGGGVSTEEKLLTDGVIVVWVWHGVCFDMVWG